MRSRSESEHDGATSLEPSIFRIQLRSRIWVVTLDNNFYADYRSLILARKGIDERAQTIHATGRSVQVVVLSTGGAFLTSTMLDQRGARAQAARRRLFSLALKPFRPRRATGGRRRHIRGNHVNQRNNRGNSPLYGVGLGIFALFFAAWAFRQQNPDYREAETQSGSSIASSKVAGD